MYAGSWKNPLFTDPKVKERSSERWRYFAYSLLVLVSGFAFFSGSFWFATQSRFLVHNITAEGMRTLPNERVALHALQTALSCEHFFAPCLYTWNVDRAHMISALGAVYHLESIAYTVNDHQLHLVLHEAVTLIPVRIGSDVWFATQTGVLQQKATPEDISAGILIPSDAYQEIDASAVVQGEGSEGMQVLTPDVFAQLAAYKKAFSDNHLTVTSFAFTSDAGKMVANTQNGFAVFFTPWDDAQVQMHRLVAVLAEATPQSYADIRFGERIYIK